MLHLNTQRVNGVIGSNENLSCFWKWILENSTSLTLPYHNLRHTMEMIDLILSIYEKSRKDVEYGFEVSDEDLYVLLVSAMFHDFSHSGGVHSDSVNVETAIGGMERCLQIFLTANAETEAIIQECSDIIKATQYPYVIDDRDLNIRQRIIRECDVLVAFYDDMTIQTIVGLMTEMRQTSYSDFVQKYMNFILESAQTFKIKFSIDIVEKYGEELVKTMKSFISIFNS